MHASANLKSVRIAGSLLVVVSFLLASCSGPSQKAMVPDINANHHTQINKSVRVVEVTGGMKPMFGGAQSITNEQFRAALVATLAQSKLFRAVQTDGDSDLSLKASIVSQRQKMGFGIEYRQEIIVSYEVIEKVSNKVVWRDTYQSEFGSMAFSGGTRTTRACEGSVRENLALLLQGINERWPANAK
jgi:hypothetical protein